MKKILLASLLSVILLTVNAQQNILDSLKRVINTTKEDTTKVRALTRIGKLYTYSKPDTTMLVAQQALVLARKIKFLNGEALALNLQGIVFQITGNYPEGLKLFVAALKINEKRNDSLGMSNNLGNMGYIANMEGDMSQSVVYSLKSKIIAEALHSESGVLAMNLNIGDAYEKMNVLDSARIYTQQGYELALKLNDIDNIATANNNLANIYAKMKNPALALVYYRTAIPLWKQAGDDDGLCESALGMAQLFKQAGQKDSSIYYARLSMEAGTHGGFMARMLNASRFLTEYFEQQGQIDSAYHYQKMSIATNEAIFSQEKTKEVQNQTFEENLRQQELTEQKLADEERSRKNLQLAGIAVFIPTFFLFILFLGRHKAKPRTVEFLGILSLLMAFEFIMLLVHPYIEHFTNDAPAVSMLFLVAIAALIAPLHHRAEHWVKSKLVHIKHHAPNVEPSAE